MWHAGGTAGEIERLMTARSGLRPPEQLEAASHEHAQALTVVQGLILSVEPKRRFCCDLGSWGPMA